MIYISPTECKAYVIRNVHMLYEMLWLICILYDELTVYCGCHHTHVWNADCKYTASQLSGIAPRCNHFASQLAEIFVNFNGTPNDNTPSNSYEPLTKFYCRPSILYNPDHSFTQEWWFLQHPKGTVSHLWWSHSVLSCRCMQITILNQGGNRASQNLLCNYWKHCSVLWSWAFS